MQKLFKLIGNDIFIKYLTPPSYPVPQILTKAAPLSYQPLPQTQDPLEDIFILPLGVGDGMMLDFEELQCEKKKTSKSIFRKKIGA